MGLSAVFSIHKSFITIDNEDFSTGDLIVTLQDEIASAAQTAAGVKRHRRFDLPLNIHGLGKNVILEFIKWFSLFMGVIGLLSYNRILQWTTNLNPLWLRNLFGILSIRIMNLPLAAFVFTGSLILGCLLATLQKRTELDNQARVDEATSIISELSKDLGKGTHTVYVGNEVLNELGEMKMILSQLSSGLSTTKGNLAFTKKKEMNPSLKKANETISILRRKIKELNSDRERLKTKLWQQEFNLLEISGVGPKTVEKLNSVGIFKSDDLLKIAPEDLADKIGVSPKIVTKWLEDAAKLTKYNT
jgi:predicted flap endonuclease-1-like 5' DNA nuclease